MYMSIYIYIYIYKWVQRNKEISLYHFLKTGFLQTLNKITMYFADKHTNINLSIKKLFISFKIVQWRLPSEDVWVFFTFFKRSISFEIEWKYLKIWHGLVVVCKML